MADPSPPENHVPPAPRDSDPDPSHPEAEQSTTKPSTRPSARGTAFYQRKRAVRACQVCRARRTKCDNLKPSCSFCLKVGAACIQSPVDLSSFDPASLKILERLDELEELMRSVSVDGPSNKTRVVEAPVEHHQEGPPVVGPPIQLGMIIPCGVEHVMAWPVFQRRFGNNEGSEEMALNVDHASVAGNSPASVLGALDMEPRRVNDLLDTFFAFVHVKNPILDETATRKMVSATVMNGIDWSPESCLSLLIFALGSIATSFGPSHDTMPGTTAYVNAHSFFQAAQKRLGVLLSSDDIIAAQCLFLSGVYMMCMFKPVKAWRYFVQALASCQQFSFLSPEAQQRYHSSIDAGRESNYSIDTLQQAVYWSSWKSEREMRGDLYLPDFSLSDKELAFYPPFFPTPPAPRAEVEAATDPRLARERTSWYFYLAEISLRRLASRISAEMVGLQKQYPTRQAYLAAAAETVGQYEEQAKDWIASLPPSLSFAEPPEEDDVCRFVLRGHAINLYELIYWPFTTAYLDSLGPNASFPRGVLPASSISYAQKGLNNHVFRLVANSFGYHHRHHGTMPMLRSCSRSALILAAAAILIHEDIRLGGADSPVACSMPPGWREAIGGLTDVLAFWQEEAKEVQDARRLLEHVCLEVGEQASPTYQRGPATSTIPQPTYTWLW